MATSESIFIFVISDKSCLRALGMCNYIFVFFQMPNLSYSVINVSKEHAIKEKHILAITL